MDWGWRKGRGCEGNGGMGGRREGGMSEMVEWGWRKGRGCEGKVEWVWRKGRGARKMVEWG